MEISFVSYKPEYKNDFINLNTEWIEHFFEIEPQDKKVLYNPDDYIVSKGGEIFFAQYKGKNIGTVALVKDEKNNFELAKMAVSPEFQGKGVRGKLLSYAIEEARNRNLKYLYLLSNKKLNRLFIYMKN